MAVIHMFGADGYKSGLSINENLPSYPFAPFGFDTYRYKGKLIPFIGSNSTSGRRFTFAPYGAKNRQQLTYTYNSSTTSFYFNVPINDAIFDDDRTGKWYIHATFESGISLINDYVRVTYVDSAGATVVFSDQFNFGNAGEQHVEVIIDWDTKTMEIWRAGIMRATTAFTRIVATLYIGYLTRANSGSAANNGLNDFYFVIDRADDPNPTGRLGSCNVKQAKVTNLTLDGEWAVVNGTDQLTVIDGGWEPSTTGRVQLAPGLVSDSRGRMGTLELDPNNTDKILACSVRVQGYLLTNALAALRVGAGTETLVDDTINSENITNGIQLVFEKDAYDAPLRDSRLSNLPVIKVGTDKY